MAKEQNRILMTIIINNMLSTGEEEVKIVIV